ncbi:hypothetical protein ACP4OV_015241 [Aristida adscensionis]
MASSIDSRRDAAEPSRRLPSIVLDRKVQFSDSRNATTATAESRGVHTMALTFWAADPPDVSFFSVRCTKPPMDRYNTADFKVAPHVVGAEGRFVLFRARFFGYPADEYFMYKAGRSPSLQWVPLPDGDGRSVSRVVEFSIVPIGHGGHYLLAALCDAAKDAPSDCRLRIYLSEYDMWSTSKLLNPYPGDGKLTPEKVITLGKGLLGWVDLSRGLLVCDLLRKDGKEPDVRFIPLPEPFPGNKEKLAKASTSARSFRDLACHNGVIRFIEMEHHVRVTEWLSDGDTSKKDFIYDSDLIGSLKHRVMDKPNLSYAWRALTWTRRLSSNGWHKECAVDVDEILVHASVHLAIGEIGRTLTFWDLYSAFPTLSMDGDDILYLKSVVEPSELNGWVVARNLGKKTVKALGSYSFVHHDPFEQAFCISTLSRHLNMTPGIEVSRCKILNADNFPNGRNNASCGDDICDSRHKWFERIKAENNKRARDEAEITAQKEKVSRLLNSVIELRNKLQGRQVS